ncbi:alpha-L-fucosidase [Nocardioides sp. AE5]|uniref:alpha-L-fucosidase n=1 Tax=Nocardioides sp. AE5 TaxID=2962573 RepID=UPI002881351E|nr:alpha-L-fucosidase [Nocardioides sp. AE5]MDT0203181.1 alpha-L-fucosidase [Nocardioides sp. AE5]
MDESTDDLRSPAPNSWFDEVKLGVFIHWTMAAIPGYAPVNSFVQESREGDEHKAWQEIPYAEMYQNTINIPGSSAARYHAEHFPGMTYADFAPRWHAHLQAWDPTAWADLIEASGAGYVVLVTKPEDGFLLWPSKHPNPHQPSWQSERDIVGELADAVRSRGIRFGVYYCGVDWTFGGIPITDEASMHDALPQSPAYVAYADSHWRELIDRYRPSVLWNDYGCPRDLNLSGLMERYREQVPDGVVNDRFGTFSRDGQKIRGDFRTWECEPDYAGAPTTQKWEACRGIGTSFGYNRFEDESYAPSSDLISEMVEVIGRGGNFLINLGPMAHGGIPWKQSEALLGIGWWMRRNGSAVLGTTPWPSAPRRASAGPATWFTERDGDLFALPRFEVPQGDVHLPLEVGEDVSITMVDGNIPLQHSCDDSGVTVILPERAEAGTVMALRLTPSSSVRPLEASNEQRGPVTRPEP